MERILVGIDGSQASEQALRWAVTEARSHNARLTVVLVAEPGYLYGSEMPPQDDTVEEAEAELAALADRVLEDERHVVAERRVELGDPRRVLRDLSRDADLLVVGSRGHGELAGLLLGSVSQYLATHAHCPVTVVRERSSGTTG